VKKANTIFGVIILFTVNLCFGQITAKDIINGMSKKSLAQINDWMSEKKFNNSSNKSSDDGSSEIWYGYELKTEKAKNASTADIWCIVSFSNNNVVTKICVYFVDHKKLYDQIKNGIPILGFKSFESKLIDNELSETNYENAYYNIKVAKSNYLSKQNYNFTIIRRD
jgi:hypothetical protein